MGCHTIKWCLLDLTWQAVWIATQDQASPKAGIGVVNNFQDSLLTKELLIIDREIHFLFEMWPLVNVPCSCGQH